MIKSGSVFVSGNVNIVYYVTSLLFYVIIMETSPYKKVTPDFHLTYSKKGGNLGSDSK